MIEALGRWARARRTARAGPARARAAGRRDARRRRRLCVALLLAIVGPTPVSAQIVRGLVTEQATGLPSAGAVVLLESQDDVQQGRSASRTAFSNDRGEFSLLAPAPGMYRVTVRRIGFRPHTSAWLSLQANEIERIEVVLEPSAFVLPSVSVSRSTPCGPGDRNAARIANLWEDARTALMGSAPTRAAQAETRYLVRYVRDLDPDHLTVLTEALQFFDGFGGPTPPAFQSLSGDSLSTMGYWRRVGNSVTYFYGPDARALLSEEFVRDHCFTLVERDRAHPGWIGLAFEPVPARRRPPAPPEISGTVWLTAAESELKQLDFAWTTLPSDGSTKDVGGQVQFARYPNGPWYVSRWFLRMPEDVESVDATGRGRARSLRRGLVEEGGMVYADSLRLGDTPATVRGVVLDPNRRPLAGATVRLLGTARQATSDVRGAFTLKAVPAGLRMVVVTHPAYDSLGVRVAERQLLLQEGETRQTEFRGATNAMIASRACARRPLGARSAALRVVLLDSLSAAPLGGRRVVVTRADAAAGPASADSAAAGQSPDRWEMETDAEGVALICGVPAATRIAISVVANDRVSLQATLTVPAGELASRTVRVRSGGRSG